MPIPTLIELEVFPPWETREYVSMIKRKEKIPSVLMYCDGPNYWRANGFHRVTAAQRLGRKRIRAMIVPGTYAQMEAEFREETMAGLQELREWPEQNKDKIRASYEKAGLPWPPRVRATRV